MKSVKAIVVKTEQVSTVLHVHALLLEMAAAIEDKPALYAVAWQVEAIFPDGKTFELMREVFDQDAVTKRAPVFPRERAEQWALDGLPEAVKQVNDQRLQYHYLAQRKLLKKA